MDVSFIFKWMEKKKKGEFVPKKHHERRSKRESNQQHQDQLENFSIPLVQWGPQLS